MVRSFLFSFCFVNCVSRAMYIYSLLEFVRCVYVRKHTCTRTSGPAPSGPESGLFTLERKAARYPRQVVFDETSLIKLLSSSQEEGIKAQVRLESMRCFWVHFLLTPFNCRWF